MSPGQTIAVMVRNRFEKINVDIGIGMVFDVDSCFITICP